MSDAKKTLAEVVRVMGEIASNQAARGDVPRSVRFAEVRSQLKTLPDMPGINWPALYEKLYAQALTEAIRQEMEQSAAVAAFEQRLASDALTLLLLECR